MTAIQAFDLTFTQWMVSLQTDWAVAFMRDISFLGNAGWIWIAIALVCIWHKDTRKCGYAMALALILGLILGNGLLKHAVARPRPYIQYPEILPLVQPGDFYSFPSGHTTSSFAAAGVLYGYYPKRGVEALVLATLIGISRLYLHVHFFTDVLAGVVLGLALAWVARKVLDKKFP